MIISTTTHPLLYFLVYMLAFVVIANSQGSICPQGQHEHESSCIEFVVEETSFGKAETSCQERGGHLVFIKSEDRNQFILDNIPAVEGNWWIGLTDREEEGTFLWLDGTPVEYHHFSEGEPNDYRTGEDCVCIRWLDLVDGYRWNDDRCDDSRKYFFVCQYAVPNDENIVRTDVPVTTFASDSQTLAPMDSVAELYLINDGPAEVGEMVTMVLFTDRLGTEATYVANFGDGTEVEVPVPESVEGVSRHIPSSLDLAFEPQSMLASVFTHSFGATGSFTVEVTVSNQVNTRSASTDVVVGKSCESPVVHINSNSENITTVSNYKLSVGFLLTAKVELDCEGDTRAVFNWTVHRVEGVGAVADESNICRLPPAIDSSGTTLVVPPYSLEYGMYAFKLTVSIVERSTDDVVVSNSDQIRVVIVSSPVVAKINGGSARTVGWSSTVTLDGSQSHDPDNPEDPGGTDGMEFDWYCRKENDPPFLDPMSSHKNETTGGCFGTGVHLSNHTEPILTVDAQSLTPASYVFRLEVGRAGREAGIAEQIVTIVPGSPLLLQIRCLQNCDVKVNPSSRFALSADCADCTRFQQPDYTWTLHDAADDAIVDADIDSITTTGGTGKNIVFKAAALSRAVAEGHSYMYSVKLTGFISGRTEGSAQYGVTINTPPSAGSCSVSPPFGYVLDTLYSVDCVGFSDEDAPLAYTFSAVTGAEKAARVTSLEAGTDSGTLLFFGQEPSVESTYLPVGIAERDYRVDIVVAVSDVYGASVQVVTSTTVNETQAGVSSEAVHEKLLNLTTGDSSPLKSLLEAGDNQMATQLLNSVSSVLNAQSDSVVTTNVTDHTQETKIRTTIVKTLSVMPLVSMEMLKQTSSAMNLATQVKTEVSREAQLSAATMYTRMGNFLKSQSASVGGEAIEAAAQSLVSGLSNVMEASLGAPDELDYHDDTGGTGSMSEGEESVDSSSEEGRNVTLATFTALEDVQSAILANKVVGEAPTVLKTPALAVTLDRKEAESLGGAVYQDAESGVGYQLPANSSLLGSLTNNYTGPVDLQLLHMTQNPFNWDTSSKDVEGAIIGLQMKTSTDQAIQVDNLPEEIEFFLPRTSAGTQKNEIMTEYSNDTRIVIAFNVSSPDTSLLIGVDTVEKNLSFQLYVRYDSVPSFGEFDKTTSLAQNGTSEENTWLLSSAEYLKEIGTYYVLITLDGATPGENVSFAVFTVMPTCLYWDEAREVWIGDGCRVGPLTSLAYTHCLCNHLTVFGMSMFVMPNTVDFINDAKLFLTFLDNPVVVSTVGAIFVLYLVLAVFARRKDIKDRAQAEVCILEDNDPFALYRYDVTVHTGYRRGAGTSASVTLTLLGTHGESEPHVLRDSARQVLQRGDTDSFLLTTAGSLGDIEAIRLWHDNAGDYPEWFAGHAIVHDLETDQRWYFLCNTWLAVDIGHGSIDRLFKVASEEDLKNFKHIFVTKTAKDLRDRHLWFSILGRPPRSNFTRLQRLTCALSLLLCSMLASIMFYGVPEDPRDQKMDFGVFEFTWQQLIVGIQSSIIVFPINFVVVQIFRYVEPRPRKKREVDSDQSTSGEYQSIGSRSTERRSLGEEVPSSESEYSFVSADDNTRPLSPREKDSAAGLSNVEESGVTTAPFGGVSMDRIATPSSVIYIPSEISRQTDDKTSAESGRKMCRCSCQFRLPWWFVYVGWLVAVATTLISAYFVMLYGLKYGKKRSIDWLVSMFVSIFESVLVEQPITVILLAAFTALVLKTLDEEDDGSQDVDDIPITVDNLNRLESIHEKVLRQRLDEKIYFPPEPETVNQCRNRKEITRKVYALLREIFGYIFFIWLLLTIAHGQRDKKAFYMSKSVENIFFNNKNYNIWLHEYSTFFNWTYERLLPGLHGDVPGFLSDQATKLVGVARFRQIRNKNGSCSMVGHAQCHGQYSRAAEDGDSYSESWKPLPANATSESGSNNPWFYQKSVGNPYWGQAAAYSGGGYVANLGAELESSVETVHYLEDSLWLDDQTRALFVEFTLYNANANLFSIVTLLIERPGIGGLLKKFEIMTTKFYRYSADFMLFVMACEILYVLFILFYMYTEGKQIWLLRKKYFRSVWNWLELFIIGASLTTVGIYIGREIVVNSTLKIYKSTPHEFVGFHEAALLAQTLEYLISLLVLLGTVKFLHLLRINPRIYLLTSALKSAGKDLTGFFVMLAVTFTAFVCMAYIVLGPGVSGFRSVMSAYEALFSLMLGHVDQEMRRFNPTFSAILVSTFVVISLFFVVNMFIALIIESLLNVRHHHEPSPDEKVVEEMISKVTSVFFAPKKAKKNHP